jgi:hypothetical protein
MFEDHISARTGGSVVSSSVSRQRCASASLLHGSRVQRPPLPMLTRTYKSPLLVLLPSLLRLHLVNALSMDKIMTILWPLPLTSVFFLKNCYKLGV